VKSLSDTTGIGSMKNTLKFGLKKQQQQQQQQEQQPEV
jgi:hypothetical protein